MTTPLQRCAAAPKDRSKQATFARVQALVRPQANRMPA